MHHRHGLAANERQPRIAGSGDGHRMRRHRDSVTTDQVAEREGSPTTRPEARDQEKAAASV